MKVIYVDADSYARKNMRERLQQLVPEAELRCFDSPESALALAGAEGCDVLLTGIDLWSDRFGGIRLAERMKAINPRVNIIFVTFYSEKDVARELFDLRISGFISKLYEPQELAAEFANLRYPVA